MRGRKKGRRTKGGKRKSTMRRSSSPAKVVYRTRTIQAAAPAAPVRRRSSGKIRYYSKPKRARRGLARRSASNRRAMSMRLLGGALAGITAGAIVGSAANEVGLLNYAPTQNALGIAATGLIGGGLIILGAFAKSEGMKLLLYSMGGGLVIEEITRQVEMRFYDFRVAFMGAPALDYSQGVSGACLQLAKLEEQKILKIASMAGAAPAQLPEAQPQLTQAQTNANALFEAGDVYFNQVKFINAAKSYTQAFKASQDPIINWSIGQAYRRAAETGIDPESNIEIAIYAYRTFINTAIPTDIVDAPTLTKYMNYANDYIKQLQQEQKKYLKTKGVDPRYQLRILPSVA
jgi:hypothetical protein